MPRRTKRITKLGYIDTLKLRNTTGRKNEIWLRQPINKTTNLLFPFSETKITKKNH